MIYSEVVGSNSTKSKIFCYCSYLQRISRYSDFPALGGAYLYRDIFARFKTMQRKLAELSKCSWCSKRKLGITVHSSEIIQLQFGENAIHCFALSHFLKIACLSLKDAWLPPIFFSDSTIPC